MTRLLCLDTETDGVDVFNNRIVTVFCGLLDSTGYWVEGAHYHALINTGFDIPEGATAVHGISTAHMMEHGEDERVVLAMVAHIVRTELAQGTPLVIYNAPFDTTILNAGLRRNGLEEIDFNAPGVLIIDPLVIDGAIDKYRKGKRTLTTVAPIYGVPVEANAHDASADCLMTGRIALRLLQLPRLRDRSTEYLMEFQRNAKAERSASFEKYLRTKAPIEKRDPNAVISREWPVQTLKETHV